MRPGPRCPARVDDDVDLTSARFVLAVDDCTNGPDRQPTMTEVFGFFRAPGEAHDHDDNVVLTGGLEVPVASPIARLAHQVSADPARIAQAGDILRRTIALRPRRPGQDAPKGPTVRERRAKLLGVMPGSW